MLIRSHIKYRHLQCFLEVVRQKSLTKAADALALTQSTVSKTLKELETDLGVRLIERNRNGVFLTEQGQEFHRFAGISVAALNSGLDAVQKEENPRSVVVRIACTPNVATRLMPRVVKKFLAKFTDARVDLISNPYVVTIPQLIRGEIDMIVSRLPEADLLMGLNFEPLYTERQVLVVRPGHPLLKIFSINKLIKYPFIMHRNNTAVRHEIERFIASLGLPHIEPAIAMNNTDFARQYVLETDAIWGVPRGVVEPDIEAHKLVVLPIDTRAMRNTVGVTTRADVPPQGLAGFFATTIREVAQDFENDNDTND